MTEERDNGVILGHHECPDCGSNDNLVVYEKPDGSVDGYCYSPNCISPSGKVGFKSNNELYKTYLKDEYDIRRIDRSKKKVAEDDKPARKRTTKVAKEKKAITPEEKASVHKQSSIKGGGYRNVLDKYNKKLGIRTSFSDSGGVEYRWYPVTEGKTEEGKPNLVGYKKRICATKDFRYVGKGSGDVDLFNQWNCSGSGKRLVLVGGEEDTLAAVQMIEEYRKNSKNAAPVDVVSSSIGEGSIDKQCQLHYDFLDGYESIIISLDADTAGENATEKLIKVLPPSKVKVMQQPSGCKDPSDALQNGDEEQWVRLLYAATKPKIAGIAGSSTIFDDIVEASTKEKIELPPFLNKVNAMLNGGLTMNTFNIIAAQTSIGKCHGKGTEILMHDTTVKKCEDVKVGDKLMGIDGSPREVLSLHQGTDSLYEVSQVKGINYVVNSKHELSLKMGAAKGYSDKKKGDTINIPVEEYLKLTKRHKAFLKGYKGNLKELGKNSERLFEPYMIGLWLADGTTSKPQYTIANNDKELIKELYDFAERNNYGINIPPSNNRPNCTGYDLNGGFLVKLRDDLNLLNNKHIPLNYRQACYEDRLEILAGILDGDGYKVSKGYEIVQKSKPLADGIVFLAKSLGLSVTRRMKFSKCQNFEGAYYHRIFIFGDTSIVPNRLTRKSNLPFNKVRNPLNTGVSVKPVGVGAYYGFEVDGDHLYCLEDMTVVHNSSVTNEILYHLVMNSKAKVGVMSLEASKGTLGEQLLSLHLGKRISSLGSTKAKADYLLENRDKANEFFMDEDGDDRFFIMDDRSYLSTTDEVFKQIDKLVRGLGVKVLIIDVLSDLMDNLDINAQAEFMGRIKKLIANNEICIIGIMHMRKEATGKDSDPHLVNEHSIYGSSTAVKSASTVLLMSRDKVNEDEEIRNTTRVTLTKNRMNGITGKCCELYYDHKAHKLHDKDVWSESQIESY